MGRKKKEQRLNVATLTLFLSQVYSLWQAPSRGSSAPAPVDGDTGSLLSRVPDSLSQQPGLGGGGGCAVVAVYAPPELQSKISPKSHIK